MLFKILRKIPLTTFQSIISLYYKIIKKTFDIKIKKRFLVN